MRGNVITVDLWRSPMHELDYVTLNLDVPEYGLRAGDVGVIIAEPMDDRHFSLATFGNSGGAAWRDGARTQARVAELKVACLHNESTG